MPTGDPQSPFVTVREMYTVKDDLLRELHEVERRLSAKIDEANRAHDATHADMRRRADDRHKKIDDILTAEERHDAVEAALLAGRSGAYRSVIGWLRTANEFRWLFAIILAALVLLTNNIHFSLVAS